MNEKIIWLYNYDDVKNKVLTLVSTNAPQEELEKAIIDACNMRFESFGSEDDYKGDFEMIQSLLLDKGYVFRQVEYQTYCF